MIIHIRIKLSYEKGLLWSTLDVNLGLEVLPPYLLIVRTSLTIFARGISGGTLSSERVSRNVIFVMAIFEDLMLLCNSNTWPHNYQQQEEWAVKTARRQCPLQLSTEYHLVMSTRALKMCSGMYQPTMHTLQCFHPSSTTHHLRGSPPSTRSYRPQTTWRSTRWGTSLPGPLPWWTRSRPEHMVMDTGRRLPQRRSTGDTSSTWEELLPCLVSPDPTWEDPPRFPKKPVATLWTLAEPHRCLGTTVTMGGVPPSHLCPQEGPPLWPTGYWAKPAAMRTWRRSLWWYCTLVEPLVWGDRRLKEETLVGHRSIINISAKKGVGLEMYSMYVKSLWKYACK